MSIEIKNVPTKPFEGQKPGTSGLRKKTKIFLEANYLENFVQSVFETLKADCPEGFADKTLIIGGDGRYHNATAIQSILRMIAANGFAKVMVAKDGILSTPAASAVIRHHQCLGGFVLSASHNPGGPDEDFGIKFNISNGGPAPQHFTDTIFKHTQAITAYKTIESPDLDLSQIGTQSLGGTEVLIFDPLYDYTNLMKELFDFDALAELLSGTFRMQYDAMNAVTGPYAKHIFEECLGAPVGTVLRGVPLEDFGGCHPDPNLTYAADLVATMNSASAADFGAASDGDGDRNLVLGPKFFISPGDSLAIITEHAAGCIPGYQAGLKGVARSMPTSLAVDRVAEALSIPCYETPTGWKYFGTLMDSECCTICGEESFGTGSSHVREKDGMWAVLCWLSLIAKTKKSVKELAEAHWERFGRSYFQRHDFEGIDKKIADEMFLDMRACLAKLAGQSFGPARISKADDFSYVDPVDGAKSEKQGLRIFLDDGSRVVFRLSGTGTQGATLRIYLEQYKQDGGKGDLDTILSPLASAAKELLALKERIGTDKATVVT